MGEIWGRYGGDLGEILRETYERYTHPTPTPNPNPNQVSAVARAIAGADGAAPAERQRGDEQPPSGVLDGVGHVVLQVCLPLALPRALPEPYM